MNDRNIKGINYQIKGFYGVSFCWTRAASSNSIKVLCALNLVFLLYWVHTATDCKRGEKCNEHRDNVTANLKAVRLAD